VKILTMHLRFRGVESFQKMCSEMQKNLLNSLDIFI